MSELSCQGTLACMKFKGGFVLGTDSCIHRVERSPKFYLTCEKSHQWCKNILYAYSGHLATVKSIFGLLENQLSEGKQPDQNFMVDPEAFKTAFRNGIRVYTSSWEKEAHAVFLVFILSNKQVQAYQISTELANYIPVETCATVGSGSNYCTKYLKFSYSEGLREQKARALVFEAIKRGIQRDENSMFPIDLYAIREDEIFHSRWVQPNDEENCELMEDLIDLPPEKFDQIEMYAQRLLSGHFQVNLDSMDLPNIQNLHNLVHGL